MKILVVDDERDIQLLFQQKFRKEIKRNEIEFHFAFSGEDALEIMKDHDQESILILSDIYSLISTHNSSNHESK